MRRSGTLLKATAALAVAASVLASCGGTEVPSETPTTLAAVLADRVYHDPGPAPEDPEIILFGIDQDTGIVFYPARAAGVLPEIGRGGLSALRNPVRLEDGARVAEHSVAIIFPLDSGDGVYSLSAAQLNDARENGIFQYFEVKSFDGYTIRSVSNELVKAGEEGAAYDYVGLVDFNNGGSTISYVFGQESIDPGRPWYIPPFGWAEATFSGVWSGDRTLTGFSGTTVYGSDIGGTASLTVDFGNRSVTGTLTPVSSAVPLSPIQISGTIESASISGTAWANIGNYASLFGDFSAGLYGPNGEEIGGVFLLVERDLFGKWPEQPLETISGGFVGQR